MHGRRRRALAALAAGSCGLLAIGVVAISREGGDEPLDPLLTRVTDAGAPGVLALVRDRDEIRTAVSGVADRGRERSVAPGDRFRIGSVTKTFVATVVLQLVAEGRVRLDDTVEKWLPGLVPGGQTITVRHLLSHTSGLADYVEDPRVFAPYARDPAYAWDPRRLAELALTHPPLFSAGRRFAYASTNYLLLGLIVETATSRPLAWQIRERVFEPLGLRRTTFAPHLVSGPFVHGHRAPSHQGVVTGPPVDVSRESASWTWAGGAIVSTADDLRRFFASLLGGKLLPAQLLREMETVVPAGRQRYGLGLGLYPTPCGDAWGHTGNVLGTVTVAWNRRDASRQIVLVVNAYPLSGELEAAVRRLQTAAFCGTDAD
jgi:D-alanyl-D-alanine carboxypeptidase